MAEQTKNPAPLHPVELRINIGGYDWKYVSRVLRELADQVDDRGTITTSMSGGAGGSYSCTIALRDITPEAYHVELQGWFDALRAEQKVSSHGR